MFRGGVRHLACQTCIRVGRSDVHNRTTTDIARAIAALDSLGRLFAHGGGLRAHAHHHPPGVDAHDAVPVLEFGIGHWNLNPRIDLASQNGGNQYVSLIFT
jgi:hypothetical protein